MLSIFSTLKLKNVDLKYQKHPNVELIIRILSNFHLKTKKCWPEKPKNQSFELKYSTFDIKIKMLSIFSTLKLKNVDLKYQKPKFWPNNQNFVNFFT